MGLNFKTQKLEQSGHEGRVRVQQLDAEKHGHEVVPAFEIQDDDLDEDLAEVLLRVESVSHVSLSMMKLIGPSVPRGRRAETRSRQRNG